MAEEVAGIVALAAAEPGISRVDDLAQRVSTSVRRLQRLFAEYVGVGPKWVIRRYRLHEITERMAAGERIDWARLAAELGYSDQTHLSRDFTSIVGESPTRYAQRYPERAGHGPGTAAMLMPGGRGRDGGGSSTCSNPSLSAAGHTVAPSTSR